MIIRNIKPSDLEEFNRTSASAFIWGIDPSVDREIPSHPVLAAFYDDDKTIMAQLECFSRKVSFSTSELGCVGIGGVATKPEYRRGGCVRGLFTEVERIAAENEWDIGILYPFSTSYYRQYGYENIGYYTDATVEYSLLSDIPRNCSVDLINGKDKLPDLLSLYNKIARLNELSFFRNDDVYFNMNPYKDCCYTYMWKRADGEYRAYASYTVKRDENAVSVKEIGFLDKESLLGILGFLRCYDGNQKNIRFEKLPVNSPIYDIISNTSKINRRLANIGSVRVYNIMSVLTKKQYPKEHGRFSFKATDSIEINNGIFDIEYQNGTAEIVKRQSGEYDFAFDATGFSRILLSGAKSFASMEYMNGIEIVNQNADFLKAFPEKELFFTDGF